MIITIDGPAGAGKSTVAKALAKQIDFQFLDTGAMYRAVTVSFMRDEIDIESEDQVRQALPSIDIDMDQERCFLNGADISDQIRTPEISRRVSPVAANRDVRERLVQFQRQVAAKGNFVCEGRDQGTIAFPDAFIKFFLTASAEQRARRRLLDLESRGIEISFEDLLAQQNRRDQLDRQREVGPLIAAEDAVHIDSGELSVEQVLEKMIQAIDAKKSSISDSTS